MLTIKGSITDKSGKTINGTFEYIKHLPERLITDFLRQQQKNERRVIEIFRTKENPFTLP